MKKILTIILLTISVNVFAQSGASTAKLQSAGNATAVALLNKIDTTTKVSTISLTTTLTYTASGALIYGGNTPQSMSVSLGSQYWMLESVIILESVQSGGSLAGMNYGFYIMNDTINSTENKVPTITNTRTNKVLFTIFSSVSGNTYWGRQSHCSFVSTSFHENFGAYTGTIYIQPYQVNAGSYNENNKITKIRLVFKKIKY